MIAESLNDLNTKCWFKKLIVSNDFDKLFSVYHQIKVSLASIKKINFNQTIKVENYSSPFTFEKDISRTLSKPETKKIIVVQFELRLNVLLNLKRYESDTFSLSWTYFYENTKYQHLF